MASKTTAPAEGQSADAAKAAPSFAASGSVFSPENMAALLDPSQWLAKMQQWQTSLPPHAANWMQPWGGDQQNAEVLASLFSGLSGGSGKLTLISPQKMAKLQQDYTKDLKEIWDTLMTESKPQFELSDRRFAGEAWRSSPVFGATAALYLLNARYLMLMAEAVEAEPKIRQRIRFAVEQWVDAMSPANFLATNPEAQNRMVETKGESLRNGILHMLEDLRKGKISQTDDKAFEVGRNVATSEGAVVFENEVFQLLQYKPLTEKVYSKPFLLVPPCINKFYILDLQPANSVVRFLVDQGHTVFLLSWRNPDISMADKTWEDYVDEGVIRAIHTVQEISGQDQANILGFCVGGTLTSCALAVLAARGERPAASLTLLTAMLDFSDTGVLDVFVDEAQVKLRETTIGGEGGLPCGLLSGLELANTFSFLRPNDLVWNYVVDNYLKGSSPPPFDLLYWNGDSTNLPGALYAWYLRHTYLQNDLCVPKRVTLCGEKVDFGLIDAPVYLYGSREDHIVPWQSAYASTRLLKGPVRFVLGASGHIAGVINPPAKKKRSHWINDNLPGSAEAWLAEATEIEGSWWPDWAAWLATHAGPMKAAPKTYGNRQYKAIEPAPGRYVRQKA